MSAPWGHTGEVKLRARSGTRRGLASAATPGGSRGPGGGVRRQRGGVASRYWPRGDHSKISLKKAAVGVHTLAQCRWQRDRAIVTSELAVKDIDGGGAGGEKQRPRRRDLQGAKWCCISSPNILVDIQHLTSSPLKAEGLSCARDAPIPINRHFPSSPCLETDSVRQVTTPSFLT